MASVRVGELQIEYDRQGKGEPILLVMGIGAQMIFWPEGFCERLAARGFEVIRFDNRDVGLSTHLRGVRTEPVPVLLAKSALRRPVRAPYTLSDMADDSVGLLDALGFRSAHVVGVSMGGMIAQMMAITHPSRVRSLTSIMSGTGDWRSLFVRPKALRALLGPVPPDAETAGRKLEAFVRAVGGRHPHDWALTRALGRRAFERAQNPAGFVRHLAAIAATGDRTGALRFLRTPTLVLHGTLDPLIPPLNGRATARAIPGARLHLLEGMGHDLPEALWKEMVDLITQHAHAAGRAG